ncbi:MAG: hypothetical protein R3A44_09905 [Caldilineaceae bacterium]
MHTRDAPSLSHLASLVTVNTKVDEDNPTFTLMLFFDPLYKKPMIPATDLPWTPRPFIISIATAGLSSIPRRQTDDWLASSIRLCRGLCFRLPELALLAGNVLTHCAALLPPVPSGFWDRAPKATPGRLRRLLNQAIFPNVLELDPELRKKNSVSDHLPKGIHAHRRQRTAA